MLNVIHVSEMNIRIDIDISFYRVITIKLVIIISQQKAYDRIYIALIEKLKNDQNLNIKKERLNMIANRRLIHVIVNSKLDKMITRSHATRV